MELWICFRDKWWNVCVHRNYNEYAQCRSHLLEESYKRLNTEYTGKILWEYLAQLQASILVHTAACRMKKAQHKLFNHKSCEFSKKNPTYCQFILVCFVNKQHAKPRNSQAFYLSEELIGFFCNHRGIQKNKPLIII